MSLISDLSLSFVGYSSSMDNAGEGFNRLQVMKL